MGRVALRTVSPATPSDAMAFAGPSGFRRRVLIHQVRRSDAMAIYAGGEPAALVMLLPSRRRLAELAIAFGPAAPRHMRQLVRFAQLTLARIAHSGVLVMTRISPALAQASRMARLAGFKPGGFRDPSIWLWKGRSA